MRKILLPLLLLAACVPILAQQSAPASGLEVTASWGLIFGGSGHNVRGKLKAQGFGEPSVGKGFFSTGKNPERTEATAQVGVLFPVTEKFYAKGLLNSKEAEVSGYAPFYSAIGLNTSCTSVAALALKYVPLFSQHIRAGLGPAFHLVNATLRYDDAELLQKKFNRPGFVLESGFSTPAYSRFFADLQVQYFYVGKADLGSHRITGSDYVDNPVTTSVNFDNTSFSSFFFSLGVGYRLRKPTPSI